MDIKSGRKGYACTIPVSTPAEKKNRPLQQKNQKTTKSYEKKIQKSKTRTSFISNLIMTSPPLFRKNNADSIPRRRPTRPIPSRHCEPGRVKQSSDFVLLDCFVPTNDENRLLRTSQRRNPVIYACLNL